MRILIIRNAYRFDYGGGERFPVHLAVELQKHGHLPTIISRSSRLLNYAEECGVPHVRGWWWSQQTWTGHQLLLLPAYVLWQFLLVFWYLQIILRYRADIVHPQSKDDFIAATLAGRLLGKRVIWTDHADLKYILANHRVWYKNPVGKLVYACSKLAAAVTLVSHSEQALIEQQLGHTTPANFVVIHNGVNDTAITPYRRDEYEHDKYVFCATSRLVTAKGIGELIEAFTRLHTRHTDTSLWLVGDGPEEKHFRELAGNLEAITFFGHSDNPLQYVASCDAFLHPSHHEGFSLSLVEAAMLARPIIACAVGGNVEIVRDQETGLFVPVKNIVSLEAAMERLYSDRTFAVSLGKAARRIYEKDFQFDQIVTNQFIPIYEK